MSDVAPTSDLQPEQGPDSDRLDTSYVDPHALRALAIRQGLARGLCGILLGAVFVLVVALTIGTGHGAEVKVAGLGACLGLSLFLQALLEHLLRASGSRSVARRIVQSLAVWGFSAGVVLLAFAQSFALPELLAGSPETAGLAALDVCKRLLLEKPGEGAAILFALSCPLALHSLFVLSGRRWAGLLSFGLTNLLGPIPIHLTLRHEAWAFHGFLLVLALGIPAFRFCGDRLEARFSHPPAD